MTYYNAFFAPCAVWLVAQSPKNKIFHHVTILNITKKPERTTAIPPARIAVLIQAEPTKSNSKNRQQQQSKMVKRPIAEGANCTT